MLKYRVTLLFVFIVIHAFSQGIDNLWLVGYKGGGGGVNLDFTGGSLSITQEYLRKMNFNEANGVICDKAGKFLFSSNGAWIANSANDTMINGSGLNPSVVTSLYFNDGLPIPQADLVIPVPGDTNKYYLFHLTIDVYGPNYALYLYSSTIDMLQDSGRGAIIKKNLVLVNDSLVPGRLTACKHANGRDWWLLAHKNNSNLYYKFLVTPFGILGPYSQNIGAYRINAKGQCVFSPDGNYFAYYEPSNGDLDIFDFDRCSGDFALKSHVDINDSARAAGVAFSSNSNVLYTSSDRYVYQFDINATDISISQTTVAVFDGFSSPSPPFYNTFYLSQLAPDGKIYINCGNGTDYMHVINKPDSLGLACDLQQHSIHLPAYNAFTIPNHPNYFLGVLTGSICDTLTGMEQLQDSDKQLSIYPNPVSSENEVTFTYPSTGEAKTIIVYNIEGKIVASYNLPQWSSLQRLKLPELSPGIYMAQLMSHQQMVNVKFIVE